MTIPQFAYPFDGCLCGFRFCDTMNKAAIHIFAQIFLSTYVFILGSKYLRVELLNNVVEGLTL